MSLTDVETKERRREEWAVQEAWASNPNCPPEESTQIRKTTAEAKAIYGE